MRKEYDLKKLKQRPGKVQVDKEATKIPVSLRLDSSVLILLKAESERLGIPYQTLISSVLYRFVNGDLVDLKSVNIDDLIKRAS
jgi:predicted DNA binding CopG/RHH family protein